MGAIFYAAERGIYNAYIKIAIFNLNPQIQEIFANREFIHSNTALGHSPLKSEATDCARVVGEKKSFLVKEAIQCCVSIWQHHSCF